MTASNKKIGIIVLAAGASVRMKEPKQLLRFEGKTLLRRAVETAIGTGCEPVVVVLGANYEKTSVEIKDLKAEICFNREFQNGLSSSLKKGFEKVLNLAPEIDALIVLLADQPLVDRTHLWKFVENFQTTKSLIVAAQYNDLLGVPALFAKETFADFAEISGDKGSKTFFEKYKNSLSAIDLPEAALDIDTKEDFLKLLERDFGT